jgi:uncharacterized membrane protein
MNFGFFSKNVMKRIFILVIVCILILSLFVLDFGFSGKQKKEEQDFFLG